MDVYEIVTQKILEQLELGVVPWHKTWSGENAPINFVSRKIYRGVNIFMLMKGGEWATYKQWSEVGGQVRKGEKSSIVVFYKPLEVEDKKTGEMTQIPYLRYSSVFHISQVDGVESKIKTKETQVNPIECAEKVVNSYIERSGVGWCVYNGAQPAYSPSMDEIYIPPITAFDGAEEYYATGFHEMVHSTGHKNRLNRDMTTLFGEHAYGFEELVAEIGASMVMGATGIERPETLQNHAAYIASWTEKIKGDKHLIVKAAGKAQKAADLILNRKDGGDENDES